MAPSPTRYFIALVPPHDISDAVVCIIDGLSQRFQTGVAKAPPHITLQPPFEWPEARVSELETCLAAIAARQAPVAIMQSGFAAFAPRVLFVDVEKTPALLALQAEVMATLERELSIVDAQSKRRGFTPHMTVASRNMSRSTFHQAWAELRSQPVAFEWIGDRLTLFRHDGDRWQTQANYALLSSGL